MIVWDKRGTGLSDPAAHVPPLDERMDDFTPFSTPPNSIARPFLACPRVAR